ncbi:DUF7507 domain-containing protein, partial [Flavobacterium sp. TSSA_36]|uniref:DUF7507 domain-containing protein n=1 Tax=Flavobacterium sp. TSSA_36 TaxID=3447669 RepID=UPI003F3A148C
TGNVTLTNVTVTDNNAVVTGGPIATLAVGATDNTTFTATHVLTQVDIDKRFVYNIALVKALDPNGNTVQDNSTDLTPCEKCPRSNECNDCTITELDQNPSIDITKDGTYVDSNNDGKTNVGDVVRYAFVIKNTGNVTLTNVTVTDNNAVVTGGPIATLAVGATDNTTFTAAHTITQDDINAGVVYNLATATAKDPENKNVTDTSSDPTPCSTCPKNPECTDCTITELDQTAGIDLVKTATTVSFSKVGDIVNYIITIRNTGNVTLYNVNIKDPLTGLNTTLESLAVGVSKEISQNYTITQAELTKGSVYNNALVAANDPNGNPVSDEDSEIVEAKNNSIDALNDTAGPIVGVNQITPNVLNVFTNDTLNNSKLQPNEVVLTTDNSNPYLRLNEDGSVDVLANAPEGTLTLNYQICEKLNTSNCDTATITITVVKPIMTVKAESICINDVPYLQYTATAVNFTPQNGITLTWMDPNNKVVSTMTNLPLTGQVLWPGAEVDKNGNGVDWPGWLLVGNKWVEGADGFENIRPTASITFALNPEVTIVVNYPKAEPFCTSRPTFKIDAVDDTSAPLNGLNANNNVLNVFNNDSLNTIIVNPNDVDLKVITPDPTGYITLNPDGSVDVKEGTPSGTYTLVYQICEKADQGNCDTATVTIPVICNSTKVYGVLTNEDNKTVLPNVPITLKPINGTTGPILFRITKADGSYSFNDMVPGDYVLQVQDANLNSALNLFNINPSFLIIKVEKCNYLKRDFGYGKTDLPVLGDFVWYDLNGNQKQDEWYDANNDGLVTKNTPDANGIIDYSKWEWIDLNGDGSYTGVNNIGELNAAGFGNGSTDIPNIFVTGPNGYSREVTIGVLGYWRTRGTLGNYGEYKVEFKKESRFEAASQAMGASGLVKILPSKGNKSISPIAKSDSYIDCGTTTNGVLTATLTSSNPTNFDMDFGVNCKTFVGLDAVDDSYSLVQCSQTGVIGNVITNNDLLNGTKASIENVSFKVLTGSNPFITFDTSGNVSVLNGVTAGKYTFTYQICNVKFPTDCDVATVTIDIAPIAPITINSSSCNADASIIDLNTLLPTEIAKNGTWIDTNNTTKLNGSNFSPFGLAVGDYQFEYKITSGDCPRSIIIAMNVNIDCKVLGCGNIIVHNAFSPNGDNINDVFKIENIDDTICYPENTIEIYNRWGVLVFDTKNYDNNSNAFNGFSKGRTTISQSSGLPTGTYYYILTYTSFDLQGKPVQNTKNGYLFLSK